MPADRSRAPAETGRAVGSTEALTPVVADVVERAGFVLDDLDVRPAGRRQVIRVVVDTTEVPDTDDGPAPGVDLDAVAEVSREVSAALDALDAAPEGEYTLEVTTPGTDRPLTEPRHWRRAWLRWVSVTGVDGAQDAGRVGPVADGPEGPTVTLATTDRRGVTVLHERPLAGVARAVVEVEFKPAPPAQVDALREARTTRETPSPATDEEETP